jgi:MoaA/NifB/PqqE/SkfB family radical SAM enzyme
MWIDTFCDYPFNRVRLTCEGNVAFCCFMRPDPARPEAEAYLGNVLDRTFDDIWFGEEAEAIRQATLAGTLHKKCQCPGCPYLPLSRPLRKKPLEYNEYPTFIEIDLPNTHCNVGGLRPDPVKSPACVMCERSSPTFRPEQNRLFEVLDRIRHVVPNLTGIHIQGIAEPFYQTRESGYLLFEVLDALDFDAHADRIVVSITTNGTLLKKGVREQYLKRVPRSITTFSIDAATPETFKSIRVFDCFDAVVANLAAFCGERARKRQFVRVHNNVNLMNIGEVVGMVRVANTAGVDCVEFNPTNGFHTGILVNETNCGRFAKAQADIEDECRALKQAVNFIRPLDLGLTERLVQITL